MSELAPPLDTPLPDSLYSCSDEECASEQSYHSDDLYWFKGGGDLQPQLKAGWYCSGCFDDFPLDISEDSKEFPVGERLDKFMKRLESHRGEE